MNKISWGIIGLGNIANKFADAFSIVENAEIKAIASGDTDHTAEQQQRHGSPLLQPGNAQQHWQKHEGGQAVLPAVELAGASQ